MKEPAPLTKSLIRDVQAYADRVNVKPETVLRHAGSYGWPVWERWKTGQSEPGPTSIAKLRAYMRQYPNGR